MKITILGTGNIGSTLGKKWIKAGHDVIFGTRDPQSVKAQSLLEIIPSAKITGVTEAIPHGDVILFATPWASVPEIANANAAALDGKTLLDATNNFSGPIINNMPALEKAAPNAKIYRAFNSLGWDVFANPIIGGIQADMFYSGPYGRTREMVEELIAEIGVRPVWVGDNDYITVVDYVGALWINMVFRRGWKHRTAFKAIAE